MRGGSGVCVSGTSISGPRLFPAPRMFKATDTGLKFSENKGEPRQALSGPLKAYSIQTVYRHLERSEGIAIKFTTVTAQGR